MADTDMHGAPIFVKVDEYKDVLETMQHIKAKVEEAKEALARINELKHEEDQELQMWDNDFIEIERKISELETEVFSPDAQ